MLFHARDGLGRLRGRGLSGTTSMSAVGSRSPAGSSSCTLTPQPSGDTCTPRVGVGDTSNRLSTTCRPRRFGTTGSPESLL